MAIRKYSCSGCRKQFAMEWAKKNCETKHKIHNERIGNLNDIR